MRWTTNASAETNPNVVIRQAASYDQGCGGYSVTLLPCQGHTLRSGIVWSVFTNTVAGPGFLAGEYVGASGEVTVAAGLGANVLVGGSNRTVALQLYRSAGKRVLNVAIGGAALHLGLPRQ
jgi:hypothetical protein